jgi:hypothetical protein
LSEASDVTDKASKAATAAANGEDSGSESEAEEAGSVSESEAAADKVSAAADMSVKAAEAAAAAAGTSTSSDSDSDAGTDGENPNGDVHPSTATPNGDGSYTITGTKMAQPSSATPNGDGSYSTTGTKMAQPTAAANGVVPTQEEDGAQEDVAGVSEAHEGSKKPSTATAVVEAADGDDAGKAAHKAKGLVGKATKVAKTALKAALKKAGKKVAKLSRKKVLRNAPAKTAQPPVQSKTLNDQYASVQTAAGQTWFPKVHALVLAPAPGSIGYASAVPFARTHDYNGVAPFSVAFGHDYDGASKSGDTSGGGSR